MSSSLTTRLPALAASKNDPCQSLTRSHTRAIAEEASDEALVALICEGDNDALAGLFRRYAHIVRGLAYRVLRDASEADDLLQDIFLLIHRKCGMFDASRGPARFWILQMTYHRAIARRRYLNSRHFYTRVDLDDVGRELAAPGTASLGLGDLSDGLLGREGLQKVLEELSENQRKTLQSVLRRRPHVGRDCDEVEPDAGKRKKSLFPWPGEVAKTVFWR